MVEEQDDERVGRSKSISSGSLIGGGDSGDQHTEDARDKEVVVVYTILPFERAMFREGCGLHIQPSLSWQG